MGSISERLANFSHRETPGAIRPYRRNGEVTRIRGPGSVCFAPQLTTLAFLHSGEIRRLRILY